MRRLVMLVGVAALASACGDSTPKKPAKPACGISLETLPGTSFVMLEALPENQTREKPQARVKFSKDGDAISAAYTVMSLSNVYDYGCEKLSDKELRCTTEPKVDALCRALEVHEEGLCSVETMTKLKFVVKAGKETDAAIAAAKKLVKEARASESWKMFSMVNNNVANVVQGLLYAKIDERNCRIKVDDMLVTVYNGKRKEDFNPVGTNPFVKTSQEFLFEDCPKARVLADLTTEEAPKRVADIPAQRVHAVGEPVHFHYVGDEHVKPEEGCTYSADTWVSWKPVESGLAISPTEDGEKIDWHVAQSFAADDLIPVGAGRKGGIFHMTRNKECAGKKEQLDVVCALATMP